MNVWRWCKSSPFCYVVVWRQTTMFLHFSIDSLLRIWYNIGTNKQRYEKMKIVVMSQTIYGDKVSRECENYACAQLAVNEAIDLCEEEIRVCVAVKQQERQQVFIPDFFTQVKSIDDWLGFVYAVRQLWWKGGGFCRRLAV